MSKSQSLSSFCKDYKDRKNKDKKEQDKERNKKKKAVVD